MKTLRISLLTALLLLSASTPQIPNAAKPATDTQRTTAQHGNGPCYWINGVWICEP